MEDLARLAVFEQSVGDIDLFSKTLIKLLEKIRLILENPHNEGLRTIRSEIFDSWLNVDAFTGYLKYIGFQISSEGIVFPQELSINKLRSAEEAIVRKLHISCGSSEMAKMSWHVRHTPRPKTELEPVYVLKTNNPFLLTIQSLFNEVLKYEDEAVQKLAREQIPIAELQVGALHRMREYQRRIKTGKIPGPDLCYDVAFLHELVVWFKECFFSWVDRPPCELCGGDTQFVGSEVRGIQIELYNCKTCPGTAQFARHKDCRALLASRRGRCGEWADCFALLCVSLGYETRHVYDTTDHVWCEVYDYDSRRWLHVDPCEGAIDTPLMYEHGWGKKLEYVIACSSDDLQDVTWRYSSSHATVRARRQRCTESALVSAIVALRQARQRAQLAARRLRRASAVLAELAELMLERQPSDYETHGRISGSKEWRTERGEIGARSHTFECAEEGNYVISFFTAKDKYTVTKDNVEVESIEGWAEGTFSIDNVFRKEEKDWKMVYLAREAGSDEGGVSWRFSSANGLGFSSLSVAATSALYEDGAVLWTVQFDDEPPQPMEKQVCKYTRSFRVARVRASLRGGRGGRAWQHAQLFRQTTAADDHAMQVQLRAAYNLF